MTRISALSDIGTSVASNDIFVLVDVSDPTTPNKKIQQQNILAAGGLLPDGSAGTPGLRFTSDTDVGLFRPTTDTLGFATGGSERLRIDSSGRVGIGTSAPGQLLDVAGVARFGVNATKLTTYSDSTYAGFFNGSSLVSNESIYMGGGNTFFYNNGSPSVTIDSTGRVGIGSSTFSVGSKLKVKQSGVYGYNGLWVERLSDESGIGLGYDTASDCFALTTTYGSTGAYKGIAFSTSGFERGRWDTSGRFLVGTSTARDNFYNGNTGSGTAPHVQLEGTTYQTSSSSLTCNSTNTAQRSILSLNKSAGSSVGSNTLVSNGEYLGEILFQGNDGTKFIESARIRAVVDGTTGADDLPTRLEFSATADGASPLRRSG
jgi:hypothetical protein